MSITAEIFTKEQSDYITQNILDKTLKEMSEHLNMPIQDLNVRIRLLIDSGQFISKDYIGKTIHDIRGYERARIIRDLGELKTVEEIKEILGFKTKLYAQQFCKKYEVETKRLPNEKLKLTFDDDDKKIIKENLMRMEVSEIIKLLGKDATYSQMMPAINKLIKDGLLGEEKKNMTTGQAKESLRIEFLQTLEPGEYDLYEIRDMLGAGYTTTRNLVEKAKLEYKRKSQSRKSTDKLNDFFYKIPTTEIDINKLTVEEWFRRWFHTYRDTGIREVTRMHYLTTWRVLYLSKLGGMLIRDVNRNHVQAYANDYGAIRSKTTVLDHMQLIRSSFKDAQLDGHIKVNPAGNIRIAYKEQKLTVKEQKKIRDSKKWLELDEYEKLKNYLIRQANDLLQKPPIFIYEKSSDKTPFLQTHIFIILVALKTGARYGEIVGLTRDDVFDSKPYGLNIDKTWDHKSIDGESFSDTKNISSIRVVSVDKETIDLLNRYISWLDEHNLVTEENTLFILKGKSFHNAITNYVLKKILRTLNIEEISMHKLRHTMASVLIAKGIDLMVVAKRLGHTDSNMVMKVYGHLLKSTEEEHNEKILSLL